MRVEDFAQELELPTQLLLELFSAAGIPKLNSGDVVTEMDKANLLDHLRSSHGGSKSKVIVSRRPGESIKPNSRKIQIEVRKRSVSSTNSGSTSSPERLPTSPPEVDLFVASKKQEFKAKKFTPQQPPIKYDWPAPDNQTPFEHQKITVQFLVENNRAFCLNDMGTGKTRSVLWAYDYLRKRGEVKSMLILCPLSTMERTWVDEIRALKLKLRYVIVHGDSSWRRQMMSNPAQIYILNHDGMKVKGILELIEKNTDIDVVVIDEIAQVGRNKATERWKGLKKIVENRSRIWGLTGTPTPNAPTDAWAQCLLISPNSVPKFLGVFEGMTMRRLRGKLVARANAAEIVSKAMQPSIRYKIDDCIDLPPVVLQTRQVEMSEVQKKIYQEMLVMLHSEYKNKEIDAANEMVKTNKLVQIACGAAYDPNKQVVLIPSDKRLAVTKEIIEEAGSKVIVFVPYTGALHAVAEYLGKSFSVAVIHGSVGKGQRDKIFDDFQHSDSPKVLVANAGAMSHGLTLTAASVIIWFSAITSNDTYMQACARITRPGQKLKQLVVNIEGSPIERMIFERLRSKQKMQGLLLEMLKNH